MASKFPEGDPTEVRPSAPRAGAQAGSNGPSGSPISPSGRVLDEEKIWKAEHELILAVNRGIEERQIDGDIQSWLDALQSLYAGEDVSMWETAKGGRGRVL